MLFEAVLWERDATNPKNLKVQEKEKYKVYMKETLKVQHQENPKMLKEVKGNRKMLNPNPKT